MIFTEALDKGQFLGSEFLTWLWYLADQGKPVELADSKCIIDTRGNMNLQIPDDNTGRVSVIGEQSDYREGFSAIREGKALVRARFLLSRGNDSYEMTLDSTWFTVKGLKVLSGEFPPDEGEDLTADFMDRVGLIVRSWDILDGLYRQFIDLRMKKIKWNETVGQMQAWVKEAGN